MVAMEFGEDFVDGAVDPLHGDFSFLAGLHETPEELLAIDGLAAAVFLDDAEFGALDLFVGCEAGTTVEAFAATTNGGTVFGTP